MQKKLVPNREHYLPPGALLGLALVITALCQAVPAGASELTLIPRLRLAEEYNDNIHSTKNNRETDFITHVNPSVEIKYIASRFSWNLLYSPEYLKYARNSDEDTLNHNLSTTAQVTLAENWFFLKASDNYSIIDTNVAHNSANNGGYNNQTSSNLFSVSPYAVFHPDTQTTLNVGYIYSNQTYGDKNAIDYTENGAYLSASRDISNRTYLIANASYTYHTPDDNADYSRTTLSGGIRRNYATNSSILLEGGYSFFNAKDFGNTSSPFWRFMLQHDFGATTATLSSGVTYNPDAYKTATETRGVYANLVNRSGRGVTTLFASYQEFLYLESGDVYSRALCGGGSYEYSFTPQWSGSVGETACKYNGGGDYYGRPYATTESVAVKYSFLNELTARLTYNHYTLSEQLWSGNSIITNQVIFELVKTFPTWRKIF